MPMCRKEIIIKSERSWFDLGFSEIFSFKDLFILLIRRDFVTSYKQTILGPFWVVIQALAGSAIFTVIFSNIAGIPTDGHPAFLFYLCGNMAWQYFAQVFGLGSNALQSNIGLFSKVYFPRLIPPLTQAFNSLFKFYYSANCIVTCNLDILFIKPSFRNMPITVYFSFTSTVTSICNAGLRNWIYHFGNIC